MNYAVDWNEESRNALAAAWLAASDRMAVTMAQAKIDRLLAANPVGNGILLSEGLYALEVVLLRVLYEITESLVEVVALKVVSP